MRYSEDADLDTSAVEDMRGGGGGGLRAPDTMDYRMGLSYRFGTGQ